MNTLKSLLKLLLIFAGVLLFATFMVVVILPNHDGLASAKERLENISLLLMIVRSIAIGTLWYFWDRLVDWYFKDGSQLAADHLKSRRTTFILLFVVIELLLVQNVLGELWQLVS